MTKIMFLFLKQSHSKCCNLTTNFSTDCNGEICNVFIYFKITKLQQHDAQFPIARITEMQKNTHNIKLDIFQMLLISYMRSVLILSQYIFVIFFFENSFANTTSLQWQQ